MKAVSIRNKSNKGFSILAVILVIVAVLVAIGVWVLSGQTNTSNNASSSLSIAVAGLINDSESIQTSYDKLILSGVDYTKIIFTPNTASTATAPNMLDPTNGINTPKVSSQLLRLGYLSYEGLWLFEPTEFMANVGTADGRDPTVVVSGITDLACMEINKQLTGNAIKYNIGISNFNPSDATSNNPKTDAFINMSFIAAMQGIRTGCIGTATENKNFFFKILKAV